MSMTGTCSVGEKVNKQQPADDDLGLRALQAFVVAREKLLVQLEARAQQLLRFHCLLLQG